MDRDEGGVIEICIIWKNLEVVNIEINKSLIGGCNLNHLKASQGK